MTVREKIFTVSPPKQVQDEKQMHEVQLRKKEEETQPKKSDILKQLSWQKTHFSHQKHKEKANKKSETNTSFPLK